MNLLKKIAVFHLFSVVPFGLFAQGFLFDQARFSALIEQMREQQKVPGCAVGIVKDGKVNILRGFGKCSKDGDQVVTADTVFQIASVTKVLTALLALKLEHEGAFSLSDRVSQYLPQYTFKDQRLQEQLQFAHVLNQTTGFPTHSLYHHIDSGNSYKTCLQKLTQVKPLAEPGKRYAYQNITFGYVSEAIQKATGLPWDKVLVQKIGQPMGLKSLNTSVSTLSRCTSKASPHKVLKRRLTVIPRSKFGDCAGPAAAANISVRDLTRLMQCMIARGKYQGKSIVAPQVMEKMETPKIRSSMYSVNHGYKWMYPPERVKQVHYGYGVRTHDWAGQKVISHAGFLNGQRALIAYMPKKQAGIVVLANFSSPLPEILRSYFLDQLMGLKTVQWESYVKRENDLKRKHDAKQKQLQLRNKKRVIVRPASKPKKAVTRKR